MKLPWVSREMYEAMLAEKDRQIAEWKHIAQKTQDRFFLKVTGAPLFAEVPAEKESPEKKAEYVDPDKLSPVDRARMRLGPRANVRAIQRYIEKEAQAAFDATMETHDPAEKFVEANAEMTEALRSGRVAALKEQTN